MSSNGFTVVLNIMKSRPNDCTDSVFTTRESPSTLRYGTSSMALTRLDCIALTRADGSDSRFQVMAAARAGREPLYASWRSKLSLSFAVAAVILYGPVPVGRASNAFGSAVTMAFGTTFTTEMRSANSGKGYAVLNCTVVSSTLVTLSAERKGRNPA